MTNTNINKIQIEYETFGKPSSPALLLIAGLGCQMIHWQDEFCIQLADKGYYVIRFDNRDTGLSSKIDGLTLDEIGNRIGALFMGEKASVPYGIDDMAADAIGVLDTLRVDKAHICGFSMGGFIAQTLCINYPSRSLSLTSIYSHCGNRNEFLPNQEILEVMLTPAPEDRKGYVDHMTHFFRLTYGTGHPFDETFHKELAGKAYDRCFYPEGTARQYLAIMTQKDRVEDLGKLKTPSLVVHGDDDHLLPLIAGKATSDAIPNSKLKVIKGMGHVIPNLEAYWSDILKAVVTHIGQVKVP